MGVKERIVNWSRIRSPWVLHFMASGCNGCDIEIIAALTPRYDLERFGILLTASPRHADILLATGAVSRQVAPRLKMIYEQMPEPKFVVAVGGCACTGGVFQNCYNVYEGIDKVIPVDVYIPDCPPNPEAIIYGVVRLIEKYKRAVMKGK